MSVAPQLVVPAKAGTYTPCPRRHGATVNVVSVQAINARFGFMGPRLRGDDAAYEAPIAGALGLKRVGVW